MNEYEHQLNHFKNLLVASLLVTLGQHVAVI